MEHEKFVAVSLDSALERKRFESFREQHKACGDTPLGVVPVLRRYDTGLGAAKIVRCPCCGAEECITDIATWRCMQ